jgi:hypothetical protein
LGVAASRRGGESPRIGLIHPRLQQANRLCFPFLSLSHFFNDGSKWGAVRSRRSLQLGSSDHEDAGTNPSPRWFRDRESARSETRTWGPPESANLPTGPEIPTGRQFCCLRGNLSAFYLHDRRAEVLASFIPSRRSADRAIANRKLEARRVTGPLRFAVL